MAIIPYGKILVQGMEEGVFKIKNPEATAELIIRIGTTYRTKLGKMFLHIHNDPDIKQEIIYTIDFMQDTVERL